MSDVFETGSGKEMVFCLWAKKFCELRVALAVVLWDREKGKAHLGVTLFLEEWAVLKLDKREIETSCKSEYLPRKFKSVS